MSVDNVRVGLLEQNMFSSRRKVNSELAQVSSVGNESVPKIIINDTVCFSETAISILVILNHNSFRVQCDNIASVYFI